MTYAWLMAPHEYEPDYDAYLADLDSLEQAHANVATYDDWFPDGPIVAEQQGGERYQRKTYRVEWVSQTGHTDQYGSNFRSDYEAAFPTREEATADLQRLATYSDQLMRWVTGKSYHEGRVFCREVLVSSDLPLAA